MIWLNDRLCIGGSIDERYANLPAAGIGAILNVAQDLEATRGWTKSVEYMQVGLIDGPGNPPAVYCAAVLALRTLLGRHKTLVCCHTGSRSLAVAIMYIGASHVSHGWPGDWQVGWDGWLGFLRAKTSASLPTPNDVHREAFDKMQWRMLRTVWES